MIPDGLSIEVQTKSRPEFLPRQQGLLARTAYFCPNPTFCRYCARARLFHSESLSARALENRVFKEAEERIYDDISAIRYTSKKIAAVYTRCTYVCSLT